MTALVEVLPAEVDALWDKLKGLVKKGIDPKRYAPEDVRVHCVNGKMQMWVVLDGRHIASLIVTAINVYPLSKWLGFVVLAGANREAWMDHLADFERIALAHGCRGMEESGRKGWVREPALKDWQLTAVTLEKDFGDVVRVAA